MKNQGNNNNNHYYLTLLTNKTLSRISNVLRRIITVVFSLDFIIISLKFNNTASTASDASQNLLKMLQKHYPLTKNIHEKYTNSKAWANLFKHRTYFTVGKDSYLMVLTGKFRALSHFNALIVFYNPSPKHLRRLEQRLGKIKMVKSFWLAGIEFTFDFVLKKRSIRERLHRLLKRSIYLRHGRIGFEYGEPPDFTTYINLRTSFKQVRIYPKPDVNIKGKLVDTLRLEITINKKKAESQGLSKPTDILNYDLRLLDEIGFYTVDPYKIETSLFNYNCHHYFSEKLSKVWKQKGFHQAQVWARKIKGCPNNCAFRDVTACDRVMGVSSRKKRFNIIQKCKHTKLLTNFRRDFTEEIVKMNKAKKLMLTSFKTWKQTK